MINLLPPQEQQALLKERDRKMTLVLGFLLLVSLVCFVLVLLSLYFYSLMEVAHQESVLQDARQTYQNADFLSYNNLISKYNGELVKTNAFYKKQPLFSAALKIISQLQRPATVRFDNIALKTGAPGIASVALSGFSGTREDLLLFKNTIEAEKKITNFYIPPNNWIKAKDISFYITFQIDAKTP